MTTLKDMLDTGRKVLGSHMLNSYRALGNLPLAEHHAKRYSEREMRSVTYCLYLTHRTAKAVDSSWDWGVGSPTEMLVCTTGRTPAGVPILLTTLAIALVIDTDILNNPSTDTLLCLLLAADRGIPVFHVGNEEPLQSVLTLYVTHSEPDVRTALATLQEMMPVSKFPFTLLSDPGGGSTLSPLAPIELLCEHPVGSPLQQLALSRCVTFFRNCDAVRPIKRGNRYFVLLYGDVCMGLMDDNGNLVFRVSDFPAPQSDNLESAN